MRLVCISDTHSMHRQVKVPDGDILIHAGDCLGVGTLEELEDLDNWFSEQPHRHKILIAGNHDWCLQDEPAEAEALIRNAIYLRDTGTEIEGLKFWGSPWTPVFYDWAFNLARGPTIAERWQQIPADTDVLVTHGPPAGILDQVITASDSQSVGCDDLARRLEQLALKMHVFGHIHESYGQQTVNNCVFINASTCTSSYNPLHPPVVVDL
ncbi:metallophosphoesterase [Marinobacter vulgaris]|uniref:Metallophosphoesterase n=1 Tax=Marinobacter vulgaris TaxID=1928331 RepID=A0A2V3ZMU8_9GAMM|nr:metallophosphatase domain-containing protein [Marinobacter vulgaris]PXX92422.1 metallophosphoesterase [Marinobacter vulgaris]TSJ71635.1 metallophosphoesterase [Marinobacter vulgaris]